jgi:hypothetical protein
VTRGQTIVSYGEDGVVFRAEVAEEDKADFEPLLNALGH